MATAAKYKGLGVSGLETAMWKTIFFSICYTIVSKILLADS